MADYVRDKPGERLDCRGMDLVSPVDMIPPGKFAFLQNIRRYIKGALIGRNMLGDLIYLLSAPVHTIQRLNDSTPNGPAAGYSLISGAGDALYCDAAQIASGMSTNPLTVVPFRPNTSVQPFAYVGDNSEAVTIVTKFLISGTPTTFNCFGMVKVRSDGIVYKTGIKEPQIAPVVSTDGIVTSGTDAVPATSYPWSNVGGANTTNYGYGHTSLSDGTSPVIITGGGSSLVPGSTIVLTCTGTATVNGASHAPGDGGPTSAGYPGNYIASSKIVVGAFTDGSGNVLPPGGTLPIVFSVGSGVTVTVPANANQLHIGIDSSGNTFSANSGSYTLNWTVTINPISTAVSTIGVVQAYVWGTPPPAGGGSPHSGPVAAYIWKNPGDGGSGTARSLTSPIPDAAPTGNSWHFNSAPQDGTVPVQWDVLNPDGTVASTIPLYSPQLESEGYQDFNACIVGQLFIPAAASHTFTWTYKDQIMVGISGGATVPGGYVHGIFGQSETVIKKLPLVFVSTADGAGGNHTTTKTITFPGAGVYDIEINWDFWRHTGRTLEMKIDGVVIPPLSTDVRSNVQYRYVYRSTDTGAQSNPSPASDPQSIPVVANGVSSIWSPDPQVDVVDYYRLDATTTNFTYVGTGPNDDAASGVNTPIIDLLTDTELGTKLLEYDNFEPFPSIDVPQKGTCNISGGLITWLTGGAIGGTSTGFNTRWLGGTSILIGSPTSLAYILYNRPLSVTQMMIPGVPDGTNLTYEIPEPILAAQPLPCIFGPTDNINFTFGVGDPLRPGTLYWCKGSNLDSAPDTNQQDVTDPSEALVNGCMSNGRGMLFSTRRAWFIMPNFFNAEATAVGTEGSTWTLQATSIDRGLFMPYCLTVSGGGKFFFRVSDGIHIAIGLQSKSITDDDLYPLFPHESPTGAIIPPQPVTRGGRTIYPPDDTNPMSQKFKVVGDYMYYDYRDNRTSETTTIANAFATLRMPWSAGLDENVFGCLFSNFAVDGTLPLDAVITGIYPVFSASASHDQVYSYYQYGVGMSPSVAVDGTSIVLPFDPASTSFSETVFYGSSLGTSLGVLAGQGIKFTLNQSLYEVGQEDIIQATSVGMAIYYTSATPTINPQMPVPFAVPAGQGVAWALPGTATNNNPAGRIAFRILTSNLTSGGLFTLTYETIDGFNPPTAGHQVVISNTTIAGGIANNSFGIFLPNTYTIASSTGGTTGTVTFVGVPSGGLTWATQSEPVIAQGNQDPGNSDGAPAIATTVTNPGIADTLVFDIQAMGWIWDVYQWPVTCRASDDGVSQQGVIVGCNDGAIRLMSADGDEPLATAVVLPPALDAGDTRTEKQWGEIFVEASTGV